jgi:hypothetical protein
VPGDYLRLAIEETPRYEGAVTTTPYRISTVTRDFPIQAASLGAGPSHVDRSDELRNTEGGPPLLIETFEPVARIQERCYLNDLVFLLQLCGLQDTITAGDGIIVDPDSVVIPTTATRHVFTKRGGITAKSADLKFGYSAASVFLRGQGFGVNQFTLDAAGQMTADLMGLVFANVADPVVTPTFDTQAIPPVRRGDLTIQTWLAASGVHSDFSIQITNPLERVRSLSLATPSYFPDLLEHGDERVKLTGSIPKRRMADADIDALLAASTFAAKARWKTPKNIAATGYKYSMWVEMPACQLSEQTLDDLANRRRFGGSYSFWAAWDEAAGYDFKITVVNSVPALETYA